MKEGKITITGSRVVVEPGPDGHVWLNPWQLGDLFGVYTAKICECQSDYPVGGG